MPEKYVPQYKILNSRGRKESKIFHPPSAGKTLNTFSVLNKHVDLAVNIMNFREYEPTYIKHLID